MSQPFIRTPEPEIPRPFKRRLQHTGVQEFFQSVLRESRRHGADLRRRAEDLWRRGRRRPRVIGIVAGALALTLVGGYTLSASGIGRSACASALEAKPAKAGKSGSFLLLMDPVPASVGRSELEIDYHVCGLPSGAAYRGRLEIARQRVTKKGSAKPKPLVVAFKDKADGVETRRQREVKLGSLKPGAYVLQLSITDSRGRERKTVQKINVTAR